MRFCRFCFLIFLVLATEAQAARAIPDDNLAYPVLITYQLNDNESGFGSGFFLHAKEFIYLVTAKHVLFKQTKDKTTGKTIDTLLSDTAELISYSKNPNDTSANIFSLDLKALLSTGHLIKHETRDVVIVRLAKPVQDGIYLLNGVAVKSASKGGMLGVSIDTLTKFDEIKVANDIFILGYPVSLGLDEHPQFDKSRPLLRKGIVAGLNFLQHSIILDCPSYPGNSGGPVIELEADEKGRHKFVVIGVIAEFVPSVETWVNTKFKYANSTWTNSGYSIATPIDFVLELLDNEK